MVDTTLLLLVGGSLVATSVAAPLTYAGLRRWGVVDVPNHRSSHDSPTIRGGGVACLVGILLAAAIGAAVGASIPWASLAACTVMAAVGFADDVVGLPAIGRLGAQVLVGAALGALLGGLTTALVGAVAVPVAVNAVNFMDGINGITSFTVAAWGVVVLVAGLDSAGLVAALALGSAAAFLPWNVPRARMFLGDSGSYLFGTIAAAAMLQAQAVDGSIWLVVAPFLPYLFDTGWTLVGRLRRRAPVLDAHREHLYQRLESQPGWSHLRVSVLMGLLALGLGLTWVALHPAVAVVVSAGILGCYAGLAGTDIRSRAGTMTRRPVQ